MISDSLVTLSGLIIRTKKNIKKKKSLENHHPKNYIIKLKRVTFPSYIRLVCR